MLGLAIKATKGHVRRAPAMASKLAVAPGASEGDVAKKTQQQRLQRQAETTAIAVGGQQ